MLTIDTLPRPLHAHLESDVLRLPQHLVSLAYKYRYMNGIMYVVLYYVL